MPLTLEQVPAWLMSGRTGHVVMFVSGSWRTTICGKMLGGYPLKLERPGRICRECRKSMKTVRVAPQEGKTEAQTLAITRRWFKRQIACDAKG